MKAPSTKLQHPENIQTSNIKPCNGRLYLVLGAWCFSGAWTLGIWSFSMMRLILAALRMRVKYLPTLPCMPLLQFVNGVDHFRNVDLVDFHAAPDAVEQCQCQFASKMFTEFLKPLEDEKLIVRIHVQHFVGEKFEAKRL